MSTSLRDFTVSYAFALDRTSMARAESETKAAEDRIVAANAAAVAKRVAADRKAQRERIDAVVKANGELSQEDRRFVAEDLKRHLDAEAAKNKAQDESFKRQRERFDQIAKASRQFALSMTAVVTGAAAAIGAATGGFLAATDRVAKNFERLHFMAESSGSSVKGMQAFGYAIAQLGGNAEAAEQQLADFGGKLKTFPQFEKNLQSMGIATRDASGKMKDAAEIAKDYYAVLAKMPRAQQDALGEVYGFAPDTIRAGTRPGLAGFMADEQARRAQIGADGDLAGERGATFERAMRRLNDDIDAVKLRIETALMALFKPALDTVAKWIEEHGKAISTTVIAIARGISDVVSAFVNTGIVKDSMKALSDGLEEFAGYISSGDFKKDIKSFVADLGRLAGAIRWCLEKLGIIQGQAGAPVVPEPKGDHDIDGSVDDALSGGTLGRARRTLGFAAVAAGGQAGRGGGPASLHSDQQKANAAAIADELRKAGAPNEGQAAVLGSMQTESSFNPRAHNDVTGGHTGLWQWDSRRWPKIRAWIESQGGDPWDARWQTRAYIAEGRAKPGDAIYDNGETSGGFKDVMDSKGDLGKAVHGVQRSERFGRGEEGGRAAHAAKWLGGLPESPSETPVTPTPAAPATPSPTPAGNVDAHPALDAASARQAVVAASIEGEGAAHRIKAGKGKPGDKEKAKAWMDAIDVLNKAEKAAGINVGVPKMEARHPSGPEPTPGPEVRGRARTLKFHDEREGIPSDAQMRAAPDKPVKVEVTDSSAVKIGKASLGNLPRGANPLADLHRNWFDWAEKHGKGLAHPGLSSSEMQRRQFAANNVRYGDRNINHSPTYNVHTSDVKAGLDAAKRQGERGAADLVRNIQGTLA